MDIPPWIPPWPILEGITLDGESSENLDYTQYLLDRYSDTGKEVTE